MTDETIGEQRTRYAAEEREKRVSAPGYIAEVQAKIARGGLSIPELRELLADMDAANPAFANPDNS